MFNPLNKNEKKFSLKKFIKKLPWGILMCFLVNILSVVLCTYIAYTDKIFTMKTTGDYPYNVNDSDFIEGKVVAIDSNGTLTRKAGTTIYKNEYIFQNHVMLNLQTVSIGNNIIVCVYHGGMLVVKLGNNDAVLVEKKVSLPPIQIGKPRQIDKAVGMKDTNFLIIVGSAEILPVTIIEKEDDFDILWGDEVVYYQSPLELKPEVSMTTNGRIAILFTDNDYNIRLVTAKANKESNSVIVTSSDYVTDNCYPYAITYIQDHILAIAYPSIEMNTTNVIHTIIAKEVISNDNQTTIQFYQSISIPVVSEVTFLDIDSWFLFNSFNSELILAYITDDETDGLSIMNLSYDSSSSSLHLGPRILNKNSGTSSIDTHGVHHLAILMLQSRKFIVYYSSILTNGFTALQIGYLSPALELVVEGPQYVISRGVSKIKKEYYYVSAAESRNRVFLLECLYKFTSIDTSFNILDIYSQPVGIIEKTKNGKATIVTQGLVAIPYVWNLVPGKYYYGNSRGELIEGEWIGQRGVTGYYVYIENDEEKMLTNVYNRIGFAVSQHEMMVLPKEHLE